MDSPTYILQTNPAFILIELDEDNYVFYNSIKHIGCRVTRLEIMLLDLMYKYKDKGYILSKFPNTQYTTIEKAINFIETNQLLSDSVENDTSYMDAVYPSSYYLHLTYTCNLKCTYCYNKQIRSKNNSQLNINEWKKIIDKISPFAKYIILTGGECFLYNDIVELLKYIKYKIPNAVISAISNCMHDFENSTKSEAFNYLNSITFSCDSITQIGERMGFNPKLYKKNIEWVKNKYPNIRISIATTYTANNENEISLIENYSRHNNCSFNCVIINPESIKDIELFPSITSQFFEGLNSLNVEQKSLNQKRIRCSAAKEVCSIDPIGNVYPCQCLHYEEFYLGNILNESINELKCIGKEGVCLPTVESFSICNKCNVKYICGGGCPASAYSLYGGKIDRNHLTCYLNYKNSINKLKHLNNRIL